jgi:hypothetical protein
LTKRIFHLTRVQTADVWQKMFQNSGVDALISTSSPFGRFSAAYRPAVSDGIRMMFGFVTICGCSFIHLCIDIAFPGQVCWHGGNATERDHLHWPNSRFSIELNTTQNLLEYPIRILDQQ